MTSGLLALVAAALFTGAAFYINFAEQPARMRLPIEPLLDQWKPSYKRGFMMQATIAVVGCLLGLLAAYQTSQPVYVAGAVLLVANWPWTVFAMFPLNHRLMAQPPGEANEATRAELARWNLLHAVRTSLGLAALVAFFAAVSMTGR